MRLPYYQYLYLYAVKPCAFAIDQIVFTVDLVRLRRYADGLAWWCVKIGDHVGYIAEESPSGAPLLAAVSIEQQRQVIHQEAERLDIAPAAAMAVFAAESAPHDLPGPHLILNFEPHILSEYLFTNVLGKQGTFFRNFNFGSPPWTDQRWRPDPSQPWRSLGGNQANEREAIDLACRPTGGRARLFPLYRNG